MKNTKKWKFTLPVVLALTASMGGYIAFGAGDSTDPLISKSYLDNILVPNILTQVDAKINQKLASLDTGDTGFGTGVSSTSNIYVTVQVSAGQTIVGSEGTQFILRSGSATAVCPGSNGLVDTTAGLDLGGGGIIQNNHVYITPRDDGRGLYMTGDGYIMVKGSYSIR